MRELALGAELLAGGVEARLDLLGVVGAASDQPRAQRVLGGRRDEDPDGLWHGGGDLARALDLDLEHDRRAVAGAPLELRAQGAVAPARVARVLDEVAGLDAAGELAVVEEVVGDAVLLPRPRRASGRRDGELELWDALEQRPDERALADPGGAGDHDDA